MSKQFSSLKGISVKERVFCFKMQSLHGSIVPNVKDFCDTKLFSKRQQFQQCKKHVKLKIVIAAMESIFCVEKVSSMIRKYNNYTLHTNPWHFGEEPKHIYSNQTFVRQ